MPITAHIPASQLEGVVTQSDDSRLPVGASVGLRLADFESGPASEPTAEHGGQLLPILVRSTRLLPDGGSEVQFELLHENNG